MRTATIRDLRQWWPEAKGLLQTEKELVITRGSKPVARLLRYEETERPRQRFNPEAPARWQLKSGGEYGKSVYPALTRRMKEFEDIDPFHFRSSPGSVFETAIRDHARSAKVLLRTLDRLHLAAMEELGIARLMTNDDRQTQAARSAGLKVLQTS